MKITRPDLTSLILCALCVVGIVVLALFRIAVPDAITYIAVGALGIGGGTALNGTSSVDSAATRVTEALSSLEELVAEFRGLAAPKSMSKPAPAPAPAPYIPAPAAPAPVPAGVHA